MSGMECMEINCFLWLMIVDVVYEDGYNARVVMMAGLLTE